jgi:hypothetical protein
MLPDASRRSVSGAAVRLRAARIAAHGVGQARDFLPRALRRHSDFPYPASTHVTGRKGHRRTQKLSRFLVSRGSAEARESFKPPACQSTLGLQHGPSGLHPCIAQSSGWPPWSRRIFGLLRWAHSTLNALLASPCVSGCWMEAYAPSNGDSLAGQSEVFRAGLRSAGTSVFRSR